MTNMLQSSLLINFLYPMLLMFFIVFAVLEKTKIFGSDKKQLNAGISLIISLIFVGAIFPKIIVANLIQFMTVGLVVIFVGMILWGFVSGNTDGNPFANAKWMAWVVGLAVFFGALWATGLGSPFVLGIQKLFKFLFNSTWSGSFWGSAIFVLIVAVAIAIAIKGTKVGTGNSA